MSRKPTYYFLELIHAIKSRGPQSLIVDSKSRALHLRRDLYYMRKKILKDGELSLELRTFTENLEFSVTETTIPVVDPHPQSKSPFKWKVTVREREDLLVKVMQANGMMSDRTDGEVLDELKEQLKLGQTGDNADQPARDSRPTMTGSIEELEGVLGKMFGGNDE